MTRFALRRLIAGLLVVVGVTTLVFFLLHLIPGDPVDMMLGDAAVKGDREELRRALGLDLSLGSQYLHFWKQLLDGSWGTSFSHRLPVLKLILERFPSTLTLAATGFSVAVVVGIPMGLWGARRPGQWLDLSLRTAALLTHVVPIFVVAPVAVLYFAIELRWLPVSGGGGALHLVLPSMCLGVGVSGFLARVLRTSVGEELAADYVRTARAKGLSERAILWRHAFRNTAVPLLTVSGSLWGGLLAGAVLTETLFDWPGLGRLFFTAFQARDYPLVQGIVLWISVSYVLIHFLVDILYSWADPRIASEREV